MSITFNEALDLPLNIRLFYIENIAEEVEMKQKEKEALIKAWQKSGSSPPIAIG